MNLLSQTSLSTETLAAFDDAVLLLDDVYAAENSFYEFVKQAWPHVDGKPFVDGWVVRVICEHLEEVYYGRIDNLLINCPPRHGKSLLVSVMFPVWCWIKDASMKFLCVSYADWLAMRDNVKSRRLIRCAWFQRRWGSRVVLADDQDTKKRVETQRGGMRHIASVEGGVTGEGGDINILDDPNDVNNRSEASMKSAVEYFTGVLASRFNDPKMHRKIVVQQRCHENDISGYILANEAEEWVYLCLPFEFEPERACKTVPIRSTGIHQWVDPRSEEGDFLWSERFDEKALRRLKKSMGSEYEVAGQLQQRPAPAAGGIIKRAYFMVWKENKPPKLEFVVQSWDTATSGQKEKRSAYSASTTWGVFLNGEVPNVLLLAHWRDKVEFPQLYNTIKYMGNDWRVKKVTYDEKNKQWIPDIMPDGNHAPDVILVEDKSSGTQIIQTVRHLNFTRGMLLPFNPNKFGDKIERVRKTTHIMEAQRMWAPGMPPGYTQFRPFAQNVIDQACMFPNAASRDTVDTIAQAFLWLIQRNWIHHPLDQIDFSPKIVQTADDGERRAFY